MTAGWNLRPAGAPDEPVWERAPERVRAANESINPVIGRRR